MSPKNTSNASTPKETGTAKPVSGLVVGAEAEPKISLYVRAAKWLKDRDAALSRFQAINPKIKAVRHPRQKSADYCFIDFATAADRDQVFDELKAHSELTVKQASKDVPELVERRKTKISEQREKKKQARDLKRHIEKLGKREKKEKRQFSSEIIIWNVPAGATKADLKAHFPASIDVRMSKKAKSPAQRRAPKRSLATIVVFATPRDAFAAAQQTVEVQDCKLKIALNVGKKRTKKNKKNAKEAEEAPGVKSEEAADQQEEMEEVEEAEEAEEEEDGDDEEDDDLEAEDDETENDGSEMAEDEEDDSMSD